MVNFAKFSLERVIELRWWTDTLLSVKTTRPESFRFESGQFTMLGFQTSQKYAYRAFSMVNSIYDPYLEFYCKIIPGGVVSDILKSIKIGDAIVIGKTPIGTLLVRDLNDGHNLWLLSTGTGLAPFLSILQDEYVYRRFNTINLIHSVRYADDLSYSEFITKNLVANPLIGTHAQRQLHYFPLTTREPNHTNSRVTALFDHDLLLSQVTTNSDRFMLCGSHPFNNDVSAILLGKSFKKSNHLGEPGDFLVEKAFLDK